MSQFELVSSPSDGISSLRFSRSSNQLCAGYWDVGVRIFDADKNVMIQQLDKSRAVLDAVLSNQSCFAGGLDKNLTQYDVETGVGTVMGTQGNSVKSVEVMEDIGVVVSGSWDGSVNVYDKRKEKPVQTLQQSGKVFSMCSSGDKLVVATSDKKLNIYDIRNMKLESSRPSSLKHQIRCVKASPDGKFFVVSSIEGRVAVEYFDESSTEQAKKYAFKCHRGTEGEKQVVYPVNAVAFHPSFGTFCTGGCDALVYVWDAELRKRVSQLPPFPTSIAALDFNHTGELLAIASSYTFEQGEKQYLLF